MNKNSTDVKGLDLESRQIVIDTIKQLREELLTKEKILEFDKKDYFPEAEIKKLLSDEIGLQLIFIPEEYGGMGGGARDCCAVTSEVASICLGVATAFFAIQLGADPLLVGGTEKQKQKWLGKIADGDTLVAYGVTEPGAGSNVAAIETKADPVFDDDGNITGYKINGTKQFISTGAYADFLTVLASTPEGPGFFVVEKNTLGFEVGKGEEKHGIRASNTAPLTFTDVFVPAENLIGEVPGQGLKQANKVFGFTRVMVAAMAYGACMTALDITINYAKDRIQFGTPLSEKQGYTHKLILPHVVNLEAAKAYMDEIALRLDSEKTDLQVEGAIAKYFTTEISNRAADDFIQALGGYGYVTEFEVEKIKRDIKITCIYEGTSEIQQSIISTFRWKKTWKTKGGYYQAIADEMAEMKNAGSDLYHLCANAVNELITIVHKKRLTKQQYIMFLLADMITYLEVGVSLVRKTNSAKNKNKKDARKLELTSNIFANETARIFTTNIPKIAFGTTIFDQKEATEIIDSVEHHKLICSFENVIEYMDNLSDIVFEKS